MRKALILKELRESAGIVVLAGLALMFLYVESTSGFFSSNLSTTKWNWQMGWDFGIPFVSNSSRGFGVCVAIGLTIALGIKQTVWELSRGTASFLLHRPLERVALFGWKLVVGIGLCLGLTGVTILAYGLWAATPGNHPSPFEWSMTEPYWRFCFSLTLLYLGAFLAGIRPGRWFGSRLVPLVASGGIVLLAEVLPWWWAGVLLVLVADGLFFVGIIHYVRSRDY